MQRGKPVPGYGPVSGLINGSNAFYVTVPGTYVGPIADNSILVDGACCGAIVADILNPSWTRWLHKHFYYSTGTPLSIQSEIFLCITVPVGQVATGVCLVFRIRSPFSNDFSSHSLVVPGVPVCTQRRRRSDADCIVRAIRALPCSSMRTSVVACPDVVSR